MSERTSEVAVQTLDLTPELDRAYRLYAAKTIEDRALPDVRDGCKPVQRRILYAMHDMGLRAGSPHRKCARIVGEVLGKYHPHGDQSVYGSLVRLAQPFAMREVLVDGQGNYGSVDGDGAAAMRYTEARLSPLGAYMLQDIDADTVDFADNFDSSLEEPLVLPAVFPNLLVNGATGIAVGMATNVPPHNLSEVAAAIRHVVANWGRRNELTTEELMQFVPGPDFPTGGVVYRYREQGGEVVDTIFQAYDRGYGRIVTQARMHVEEIGGGKANIVVTELPYNVQTSTVLERIAREVKDGRIGGVTDLRDESDFDRGMRVVVEVSRTARPDRVMADLLRHSQLQETFGCNNLALVPDRKRGGVRPQRLSLREMLVEFIEFRLRVVERRTRHEIDRRRARLHVVTGLLEALAHIDEVVAIIRKSKTPDVARARLEQALGLSEIQARAILDMPLRRLTALETSELREEAKELRERIVYLDTLLAHESARLGVVAEETARLGSEHGTPRRTVIIDSPETVAGQQVVTESDLRLPEGPQMVLVTTGGIERRPAAGYRYDPGAGLSGRATATQLLRMRCEAADAVLLVSSGGRAWRNQVGFVPAKATFEQVGLERGEAVVAVECVAGDDLLLVVGTRTGRVKRTRMADLGFSSGAWTRVVGFADDGDAVTLAGFAGEGAEVLFATSDAQVLRMRADDVNPQASGSARGMAGIGVKAGERVIGGAVIPPGEAGDACVYVVSERGYVKRVPMADFPVQGRGSRGVRVLNVTRETGAVAAVAVGPAGASLDVVLADGRRFHAAADEVPTENRYNRGRRLFDPQAAGAEIAGAATS